MKLSTISEETKKWNFIPHEISDASQRKVGTDLCDLNSKDYPIIDNYTTNYFDISEIPDKNSSRVVCYT